MSNSMMADYELKADLVVLKAGDVGASLVGMAGAAVLANARHRAASLQKLAEEVERKEKEPWAFESAAPAQPSPAPEPQPQRGGSDSLPSRSRPPLGAVAAAVALALSNARRLGETWVLDDHVTDNTAAAPDRMPGCGGGARWKPHELEIVVRAVRQLPEHTTPADTDRILTELGWPSNRRTKLRLLRKLSNLRARMLHGGNPEDVLKKRTQRKDMGMTYKAWAIRALQSLPGGQGTAGEIGAVLLADPLIGPKMDQRIYAGRKATPQWLMFLRSTLAPAKGFFNTGHKRDGYSVFAYNPVGAATAKRKRVNVKGQAGLPYLGKRSRNAN